ncbi:Cadherin-23 [Nymphon striatum]|nr:Cadherin-23 [Nymphon striatum]
MTKSIFFLLLLLSLSGGKILNFIITFYCWNCLLCNSPPRFILNGDSEIVLKLKESPETPVGKLIYQLRGEDADGDDLVFGAIGPIANNLLRVEKTGKFSAAVYLNSELDREIQDSYTLVLSLSDGKLGNGNYITQTMLLIVVDINDNEPVFKPFQSTITISENMPPAVIETIEAVDRDEGPFGQVIYKLEDTDDILEKFSIKTVQGKGVIRLLSSLDYEEKYLYQLRVLAIDQAFMGRKTATAAILIRVEDKEDQPPEFALAPPVTRIPENYPVDASVLKVKAIDGDRGINNPIEYKIIGGHDIPFNIDSTTGEVTVRQELDREKTINRNGAYILHIQAQEITTSVIPPPKVDTEVTVILTDVNDETPTFRSSFYEAEIIENAQVNVPIDFVGAGIPEVYDHDLGKNGTFNLYLIGDNSIFEVTPAVAVNEASFLIRVKNPSALDYERIKQIKFQIVAEEAVQEFAKRNVVDFRVLIPENSLAGTQVAWVKATDQDSGTFGTSGIRYTDVRGQIADLLSLDYQTGQIALKKDSVGILDREKTSEYYLTVEARDNNGKGNRNTAQIHLVLEDVNDNAPMFLQPKYEARIEENQLHFNNPLIVQAKDEDLNGTKNHEIRYNIIDGDPEKNFTIDSVTGQILPNSPIDFERINHAGGEEDISKMELKVRAYDLGEPSLFSDVSVIVYIKDMNDHAPRFQRAYYSKSISEDATGGSKVLQVVAYDADQSTANHKVAYRIQNGAFDKFVIDADAGVISVADRANLDPDLTFPKINHYILDVVAIDGGIGSQQKKSSVIVNITINDINNKPPSFVPFQEITILENVKHGHFITQVQANDPDDRPILRYSINNDESEAFLEDGALINKALYDVSGSFEIDAVDGSIQVSRELDREIAEFIKLSISVEDMASVTGKQTATAILTIRLLDVNDNAPTFREDHYRGAVRENAKQGVNILTVTASDADKDNNVEYKIDSRGQISELVQINHKTGEIAVKNRIDREIFSWLNFTVIATDFGAPPKSGYVEVFVQVLDENDNNPVFVKDDRDVTILENADVGSKVTSVRATDSDIGEYGKITYLLDSKSSQGKFTIDRESGIISIAEKLDREVIGSYNLIVQAWDNYEYGFSIGESRNAFKQITVIVKDINDEVPFFIKKEGCTMITEYHNIRDNVAVIEAEDKDDPLTGNGQLLFSIIGGNEHHFFTIASNDIKSATIVAKESLVGKFGNYSLIIKAADRGYPQQSSTQKFDICVTDVNDNAPVFISPPQNITIKIAENATVETSVVKVEAVDRDTGKNGEVHYRLKPLLDGHWRTFMIDEMTGVITLAQQLDREVQANYKIRVEAFDMGQPTLLSDLDLSIYVTNINDFAPQFVVDTFVVHFKENQQPGLVKKKLVATVDKDKEDEEETKIIPCYFVVGGEGKEKFPLDPFTHEIKTAVELDREKQSIYKLIIRATDDCFSIPAQISAFSSRDDTLLHLQIEVDDVNDNAPKFIKTIFTGGVTTETDFGTIFMNLKATDEDRGVNSIISYFLEGEIISTLSNELEKIKDQPFLVDKDTGDISLNFDPQKGMKGYFEFRVKANDSSGLFDTSKVFLKTNTFEYDLFQIYLLREDQRVKFILRLNPSELREKLDQFRDVLANITGAIVNVDEYKFHENLDGSVDKTKSDLYLHFVQREDNSIMEVNKVLSLIDKNTEFLVELFKEYNVLDSMPAESLISTSDQIEFIKVVLIGLCIFLLIMLLLILAICLSQRNRYKRRLKAATATAFGSHDSGLNRVDVPNTNQHSVEGSNPMWMQGYDNEGWVKDDETMSDSDNSDVDYEPMESDNETIDSYESDDVDLSEHEDDGVMPSDSWKIISDIFSDCRPNSLPELVRNFSVVNPALNCNANNSVLDCFKKFITNDVIVLSCDRMERHRSQASIGNNSLDENVIDSVSNLKKNGKLIRKPRAPAPSPPSRNTENSSISDENNENNHLMTVNKNRKQNDLNKTYKNNLIYETSKKITNPLILKIETSEL